MKSSGGIGVSNEKENAFEQLLSEVKYRNLGTCYRQDKQLHTITARHKSCTYLSMPYR